MTPRLHNLRPLLALALAVRAPAGAQETDRVSRGEMRATVRTHGTVVADDVIRLKSAIEGRVETVLVSSRSWAAAGKPLGLLANRELAAMLDSRQTTSEELLQERWRKIFQPTPILCPGDCYVLQAYARPKRWVRPGAVLFEAARVLRLVGRVRPEDRDLVHKGLPLEAWPESDPSRKFDAVVEGFGLDPLGGDLRPRKAPEAGGTLTARLGAGSPVAPGTAWEGIVVVRVKRDTLRVPTAALIRWEDSVYLPVRVSTGITTAEETEVVAGVEEKRPILVLDGTRLRGASPHRPEPAAPSGRGKEAPTPPRADPGAEPATKETPEDDLPIPSDRDEPTPRSRPRLPGLEGYE